MGDERLTWLSAHIFYHADPDDLLTEFVLPLIDTLRGESAVSRAFFLRHWERGPHVRLRLQLPADRVAETRERVARAITQHLTEHPGPVLTGDNLAESLRTLSQLEHGSSDLQELHVAEPPNTFRWLDYEPEYAKYGGTHGVAIAENVFDVSSTLAGHVLRTVASHRARLGIALQFLLLTGRALGLDDEQRVVFLRHYQERWVGYVGEPDKLFPAWDDQYRLQRETYHSLVEAVATGSPVGKGLGRQWEHAIGRAVERLRPLVHRREVWPAEVDPAAPPFVALAALACQFLHTTNNRMNVRPQGECFVAYLGRQAATEWSGQRSG